MQIGRVDIPKGVQLVCVQLGKEAIEAVVALGAVAHWQVVRLRLLWPCIAARLRVPKEWHSSLEGLACGVPAQHLAAGLCRKRRVRV